MRSERRSPPVGAGEISPVAWKRHTQRTALAMLTPKRLAAALRDRTPTTTASTTRVRRSSDTVRRSSWASSRRASTGLLVTVHLICHARPRPRRWAGQQNYGNDVVYSATFRANASEKGRCAIIKCTVTPWRASSQLHRRTRRNQLLMTPAGPDLSPTFARRGPPPAPFVRAPQPIRAQPRAPPRRRNVRLCQSADPRTRPTPSRHPQTHHCSRPARHRRAPNPHSAPAAPDAPPSRGSPPLEAFGCRPSSQTLLPASGPTSETLYKAALAGRLA